MTCDFIKDYGAIFSPVVAFILGVITILIKTQIEKIANKRQVNKSFDKAKEMISKISLPDYLEPLPERGNGIIIDANTARNITHISRFYFGVSATKAFLNAIQMDIMKSNDPLLINQSFYLSWRLEKLIIKLEEIRNGMKVDFSTYYSIKDDISSIISYFDEDWYGLK